MNFTWTKGQEEALEGITALFEKADPQTAILTGAAGTGKTTLCRELVERVKPLLCALTHKACAVLSEKTGKPVITLAKLLKSRKYNNYDTGETKFRSSMEVFDIDAKVVFIDEGSMLSKEDFATVSRVLRPHCHVLLIGDKFQLPPVGEHLSEMFLQQVPLFELTEPVRFEEGSGIDCLSRNVRNALNTGSSSLGDTQSILKEHSDVEWLLAKEAVPLMIAAFKKAENVDDVRMISFTNRRVEQFNYHLKQAVTGDAEKFKVGDILLANEAFSKTIDGEEIVILMNNQSVMIKAIEETMHEGIPAYSIRLDIGHSVYVPKDRNGFAQRIENMKQTALQAPKGPERKFLFRKMFVLKEKFADLRLNYAQTVHKAQGSSYKVCFFDMEGLNSATPLGRRLLYTGITRAAEKLVMFK